MIKLEKKMLALAAQTDFDKMF